MNLTFRPESYSTLPGPVESILSNVKGDLRRQMIRDLLERGIPIEDGLLDPDLDPATREFLGRIDFQWMGGEYLPGYRRAEVEIARITVNSVTRDVVSIRARRSGGRYFYSVVDEWMGEWKWSPKSSRRPLTQSQLIRMIDGLDCGAGDFSPDHTDDIRAWQKENGQSPSGIRHWLTISSEFYPDLEEFYEDKAEQWVRREFGDDYEEMDEDAEDEDDGSGWT